MIKPSTLWWWSCRAHKRGWTPVARLLKTINYFVFRCILPYQAEIERDIDIRHYGMGIVVHPNVRIGHRVTIWQNVTLAAETRPGSQYRLVIGDGVMIGAGAVVLGKGEQDTFIGAGVKIGANAVVTGDVEPGLTVVGVPARPVVRKETGDHSP